MFETLNERLEKIVSSIRGKAVISESDLDTTMREIRISLLEADVALSVVKSFVDKIKSNILGNDFVIIDKRVNKINITKKSIARLKTIIERKADA